MTNKLPKAGQKYIMYKDFAAWKAGGEYIVRKIDDTYIDYTWVLLSYSNQDIPHAIFPLESFFNYFKELPEKTSTDLINELGANIKKAHSLVDERGEIQKAEEVQLDENVNSVEVALGAVKQEITHIELYFKDYGLNSERERYYLNEVHRLKNKAQNLVNAIEAEKTKEKYCYEDGSEIKDINKAGNWFPKEEFQDKNIPGIKPNSLWKPVSELPKDEKLSVIVELESGEKCFSTYIKQKGFCEVDGSRIGNFYGEPYQSGFSPRENKYCTLTDFINHQQSLEDRIERLERKVK